MIFWRSDLSRITWDSAKQKDAGGQFHFFVRIFVVSYLSCSPTVLISQISDLVIGQKTKVFENSPVPGYEVTPTFHLLPRPLFIFVVLLCDWVL